jgi:hypothetical protein
MSCLKQPGAALAMAGLLTFAAQFPVRAQGPVNLNGRLTTGFFSHQSSETRTVTGAPTTVRLNLSGYVGDPNFMTYSVRPNLTLVEGASQTGFGSQRDSIVFSAAFFKKRWFPFSLSYSFTKARIAPQIKEFDRADRFEDPLEQVFTFSQQIVLPRLPKLTWRYTNSGLDSGGSLAVPSGFKSRNTAYGIALSDRSWGWKWSGSFDKSDSRTQRLQSVGALFPVIPHRERSRLRFRSSRRLWGRSRIDFDGGENQLGFRNSRTVHKTSHRFLFSKLDVPLNDRLGVSFSSSFSSDLNARDLEALLDSSEGDGAAAVPGTETRASALGVTGGASYKVSRDLSVTTNLQRSWVQTPDLGREGDSSTTGISVGIGYSRAFSWARLTAQYGYGGSRSTLSGIAGRSQGHQLSLSASRGSVRSLRVEGSFAYRQSRSDREVETSFLANTASSREFQLSLSRRVAGFVLDGSVGVRKGTRAGEFPLANEGWYGQIGLRHSRFNLNYGTNGQDSTEFAFPDAALGVGPLLPGSPLQAFLTSGSGQHLSAEFRPASRLRVVGFWSTRRDSLDNVPRSDRQGLSTTATYTFRQLDLEAGYTNFDYRLFTDSPTSSHQSTVFLRVVRNFTIL